MTVKKYEVVGSGHHYARDSYVVKLLEGEWDTDADLITLCDNNFVEGKQVLHFGGHVDSTDDPNIKVVSVYID